eukprot:1161371-Pelagomonas_calceolata.AAC.5
MNAFHRPSLGIEGGLSGPWGYACCNGPKARGLQLSRGPGYTGAREVDVERENYWLELLDQWCKQQQAGTHQACIKQAAATDVAGKGMKHLFYKTWQLVEAMGCDQWMKRFLQRTGFDQWMRQFLQRWAWTDQ